MNRPWRWTGGQYSLYRALFGAWLCWLFCRHAISDAGPWWLFPALLLLAGAALLFALGSHDRTAAGILLAVGAVVALRHPALFNPSLPYLGWLLLAHLFLPPAPYGSWAARGRSDPGGGWGLPRPVFFATWVVMAAGYSFDGWRRLGALPGLDSTPGSIVPWLVTAIEIGFAPLALVTRLRPWLWAAMALVQAGRLVTGSGVAQGGGMLLVHLFTFDPRWAGGGAAGIETLFYDGGCGLCHRAVRFLLAEDPDGTRFRYAPLAGAAYNAALGPAQRQRLPDSLVLVSPGGEVRTRWRAVRRALVRLGGFWTVLGRLGWIVPPVLGDAAYDLLARVRGRLFEPPASACPVTPEHLRERFNLA